MSSEICVFDNSFFLDSFPPLSDSIIDQDLFQDFNSQENPIEEINYFNQIEQTSFSNNTWDSSAHGFSGLDEKTKACQVPYHSLSSNHNSCLPQTSRKSSLSFQPCVDSLLESPNFQPQILCSHENTISSGQIRRVYSPAYLQVRSFPQETTQKGHMLYSSPIAAQKSIMEETNLKFRRYTAEERKERIHRYRAKRTQRNFNKTIKYVCRKTLADNRQRIRGRFARNDEAGQSPKAIVFNGFEMADNPLFDGFHEQAEEGTIVQGGLTIQQL